MQSIKSNPRENNPKNGNLIAVTSDGVVTGEYWTNLAAFEERRGKELYELHQARTKKEPEEQKTIVGVQREKAPQNDKPKRKTGYLFSFRQGMTANSNNRASITP